MIWGDSCLAISHLLVFIQVLITEFLESSGCLLIARDSDIIKIEPLALSYWEFTLSGVILPKINRFPFICIQIIFFSNSYGQFCKKRR